MIEPQELKSNPLIGETLDLSQVEFKVYQVIYTRIREKKTTFESTGRSSASGQNTMIMPGFAQMKAMNTPFRF